MNSKLINNIHTKVDSKELYSYLTNILKNENLFLQFSKKPDENYFKQLDIVLQKFSDKITVRFFSYNGIWSDLSFLIYLKNIKKLIIDEPNLNNLELLGEMNSLNSLTIGYTENNILDIWPITNLNLKSLVLEGKLKNLESIVKIQNLISLKLWNMKINNFSFLLELKSMKELTLNSVYSDDIQNIISKLHLTKLSLIGIKKLDSLKFINKKQIESLHFELLNTNFEDFDFSEYTLLKSINLINLNYLNELINIENATNLKNLQLIECENLIVNEIHKIKNLNLQSLYIEFKNEKKNKYARSILNL